MRGFQSRPENQKLLAIVSMLGAPTDGEKLNALSALENALEKRGSCLNRVLMLGLQAMGGPNAVSRAPDPAMPGATWKRDALLVMSCPFLRLNVDEKDFCRRMRAQDNRPSEKQLAWLARLLAQAAEAREMAA